MKKILSNLLSAALVVSIFMTAVSPIYITISTIILQNILPVWFVVMNYIFSVFIAFFMIIFLILFIGRRIKKQTDDDSEEDDSKVDPTMGD